LTVDRNAPLLNELIGLAARTDTSIADVFVQADAGGGFIRHGVLAVTVGWVIVVRGKGYRTIGPGSGAGWPVLPRPAPGELQIQRETEEGADKNHQCQHTNRFKGQFL